MSSDVNRIEVVELGQAEKRSRRIAIGTFDGVHLGHRAVIEGCSTVLTFEPHPLEVLNPTAAPKLLMPFEVKRDVLEGIGVEELVVIPFDREFTRLTAEEFIEDILIERLGAEAVSVGENFRFGTRASGTPEMLASHPGFETRVVPLVEVGGEAVSSTRIRALVAAGAMEEARAISVVVHSAIRPPTSSPMIGWSLPAMGSTPLLPMATRPPSASVSDRPSIPAGGS
jgi:riboflavin kinase/FMN adenylyltransferase